jgi:hypothetical protein
MKAKMTAPRYVYSWGNNPVRAERKGHLCRVLGRDPRRNTVLVQFDDGHRMTTSGNALRKPR